MFLLRMDDKVNYFGELMKFFKYLLLFITLNNGIRLLKYA